MMKGTKSTKRSKKSAAVPALRDEETLQAGDVVMLPDGAVAAIEKVVGDDAYVIEWHKQLGRGPWIYPVGDLVRV